MNPIVLLAATDHIDPTLDHPRPDRRVAGNPLRKTWLLHEAGPMSAGVSTSGLATSDGSTRMVTCTSSTARRT